MNIFISGINGKMGRILKEEVLRDKELHLVGGLTRKVISSYDYLDLNSIDRPIDVIIDFSHPFFLPKIINYAITYKTPLVIGTTGYNEKELELISETSKLVPIIYQENFSLGVNAIKNILNYLDAYLSGFDVVLLEKHHKEKKDQPSGTAKLFLKTLQKEAFVVSVRVGNVVGEHKIFFNGCDEEIEITHRAYSKKIFALGAIKCAKKIFGKSPKLYTYDELMMGE